ncbi:MAG: hypothetical protein WBX01_12295 [Nitrososphaeraceae archaeon]
MEIKTIAAVAIVVALIASLMGTAVLVSDANAQDLEERDGHGHGGGQFNDQDEQNWNNQQDDDSDFHCLACFGGVELEF